jgi:putative RecB family exonuclease
MIVTHLSASRIKTYRHCSLQYHAIYELKIEEDHVHPLTVMGSAVHKSFEVATTARRLDKREHLWNPIDLVDPYFKKLEADESLLPLAIQLCQNGIDWGYFRKIDNCVGCEVKFFEALEDGTMIKGFIDRLDITGNTANVIDIKTQKRRFTHEQLKNNWQAKIYNIAVRRLYPEITGDIRVSFWVLRHLVQTVTLTAEDAINDSLELMEVAKEIRACDNPVGNITPLCNWCRYQDQCPEKKGGIKARFKKLRGK